MVKKNDPKSDEVNQKFQEMQAREHQRIAQQGLGKGIISVVHEGARSVAVGKHLLSSGRWKTFHDFLSDFIRNALGNDWGTDELKKDLKERHPVVQWYQYCWDLQQEYSTQDGQAVPIPHIGASVAYYGLAYNLYLLQHNVGVQSELIRRVKLNDSNFYGALYETYVAAHFIKAGFDIEFEDERDGSTTHCEFTATHKATGRKFSVEAKALQLKKRSKPKVVKIFNAAEKKAANHERIVFIDLGKPAANAEEAKEWLTIARDELRKAESTPMPDGSKRPPAYVILTNNSYWYDLQGQDFQFAALAEGFLIPTFKDTKKGTLRTLLAEREKHKEVYDLLDSMEKHQEIPATFDGENPELAFDKSHDDNPRLVIGHQYLVPNDDGVDVVGTLRQVVVDERKKLAIGSYDFEGGGGRLISCPMSDVELEAYKKHPDTFFGKVESKKILEDPLDMYDWLYNMYRRNSKGQMLTLMANWENIDELKGLSQDELVKLYCEGATEWAVSDAKNGK